MSDKQVMVGPGVRKQQQQQPAKKEAAVIATIPTHVRSYLHFVSLINSLLFLAIAFKWIEFDEKDGVESAMYGICLFYGILIQPIFVHFITRIQWGQRGGG